MSDLISRQAVYDILDNLEFAPPANNGQDIHNHTLADVWEEVTDLPSEDRPTGEWIEHKWAEEVEGLLISNYECSECHSWERNARDYCPSCGAKMRGKYNGDK